MDIEFDEIKGQHPENDGKMLFIYQSAEMKSMFNMYGNEMILLDATYKTTKYFVLSCR